MSDYVILVDLTGTSLFLRTFGGMRTNICHTVCNIITIQKIVVWMHKRVVDLVVHWRRGDRLTDGEAEGEGQYDMS